MIGFVNGEKLLTESDLPPQWNLLSGTSDWSGNWDNLKSNQYVKTTQRDSNGNLLLHYEGSWHGVYRNIQAYTNEVFAFGINVTNLKTSSTIGIYASASDIPILATYIDNEKITLATSNALPKEALFDKNEHRITVIGKAQSDEAFSLRIENNDDNGSMDLSSAKLERGSKATAWMPAIADLMLKNQNGGN